MKERLEIKTAQARKNITTLIERALRGELIIYKEDYRIERSDYETFSEINIFNNSYMFTWPEIECVQQVFSKYYEKYGVRFLSFAIESTSTTTPTLNLRVSTPYIRISVRQR